MLFITSNINPLSFFRNINYNPLDFFYCKRLGNKKIESILPEFKFLNETIYFALVIKKQLVTFMIKVSFSSVKQQDPRQASY